MGVNAVLDDGAVAFCFEADVEFVFGGVGSVAYFKGTNIPVVPSDISFNGFGWN